MGLKAKSIQTKTAKFILKMAKVNLRWIKKTLIVTIRKKVGKNWIAKKVPRVKVESVVVEQVKKKTIILTKFIIN